MVGMLSWAQQRRVIFLLKMAVFFIIAFCLYAFVRWYQGPNCANNIKDGDERGVDCGGRCPRVCRADAAMPLILFARALPIDNGLWGAVASIENRIEGAGARNVPYVFKLYDANNLLVYERHGTAFIPPRKTLAIFEGRMDIGNRTPTRATFEFLEEPVFVRMTEPELSIHTRGFRVDDSGSSLQAIIVNPLRVPVSGIEVVALLFSADGNILGASSTALPVLKGESSALFTFTWPRPLPNPDRIEVTYTVPGI